LTLVGKDLRILAGLELAGLELSDSTLRRHGLSLRGMTVGEIADALSDPTVVYRFALMATGIAADQISGLTRMFAKHYLEGP
jgi:hypothetical protein